MKEPLTILLAEDDENDVFLVTRALEKLGFAEAVHICREEEATQYLQGEGRYSDRAVFPFPNISSPT